MARLRQILTTAGQLVPFRPKRIADSIREAVGVCGLEDGVLADELAGVVTLFLEKHYDDAHPPSSNDVREMVHKVLVETGHARIAKAFKRLRAGRWEEPASGAVARPRRAEAACAVEVIHGARSLPSVWNRERLVRSLVDETRMSDAAACEIATGVEAKLVESALDRMSTSLIREFVNVELALRGHRDCLSRYRLMGVSKRRVEGWLFPEGAAAPDPEEACARGVLEDYALEEIHGKPVAKAHIDGRIHVHGLGHPQRVESVRLDATGPLFPEAKGPDDFLLNLVTLLQAVRPLVRRRIVIARFSDAFAAVRRRVSRRAVRGFVTRLLDHLVRVDVFGRPVFPPLTLEIHLTGDHLSGVEQDTRSTVRDLSALLLAELERSPALAGRLGLTFLLTATPPYHWPESEVLKSVLAAARKHRGVGLRLLRHESEARFGALEADQRRVHLEVGAVAINVPYAFALADVRHRDDVPGALEGPVGLAVDALFEKYWLLRRSAPETLRGVLGRLPGGQGLTIEGAGQGAQLLLWGLPQALRFLESRGVVGKDGAPAVLAGIFGCADYLAGEERESIRLKIALGGVTDRVVRARLLEATESLAIQLGCDDLATALVGSEVLPELPLITPLLDSRNDPVLRGAFLDRLGTGLPLPARGDDEIVGSLWLQRVFESTRLTYLELEERSTVFEVQESLFGARDD